MFGEEGGVENWQRMVVESSMNDGAVVDILKIEFRLTIEKQNSIITYINDLQVRCPMSCMNMHLILIV